jgi:hypothetical protein
MSTLHEALHTFLHLKVTGWGIPAGESPTIHRGQRLNYGTCARNVMVCVHFQTCFLIKGELSSSSILIQYLVQSNRAEYTDFYHSSHYSIQCLSSQLFQ